MKNRSLPPITIGKRPKGIPRWQWQKGRHKIEPEKTENKFIETLSKILVYGTIISLIAVPILLFYTFDRNSISGRCFDDCRNERCKLAQGGFWCYEWEDCGPSWLPGTQSCCSYIGSRLSTKEACVNDCQLNYCPQKISWKYTILAGIPMWIILVIWLCLYVGVRVEILIKNRRR